MAAAAQTSEELVREARTRARAPQLESRLRFVLSGGGVIAGAIACALVLHTGEWWRAVVFVAVYALVSRVEFEVGSGVAVASEVVLVPMLFVVPLGLVPAVVAAGFVVAMFVRRPQDLLNPTRALPSIGSAAHAFGPVIVLAAAGGLPLRWSHAPIYVAALGAQFAFDAVAAVIGNVGRGVDARLLGRFLVYAWSVDAALAPVGLAVAFAARDHWWLVILVLPLALLLRTFAAERTHHLDSAIELSRAYRGTTYLLGDVIDADDEYTGSHSRHVVELVLDVGVTLGLDSSDLRDAEFAALLHDVGKIRIPHEILHKPGPLTPEERAIMETHAVEGEQMLSRIGGLLARVGTIVRSCHERWDGAGYPDGLSGEEIPLVSRIVSVCDAYSAMTTDRPYRPALPEHEAWAELERCSGTQFDPQVVDALRSAVSDVG